MKYFIMSLVATINVLASDMVFKGSRPTSQKLMFGGHYHIYSSTHFLDKVIIGGWLNREDRGSDKLYMATLRSGTYSNRQPIQWDPKNKYPTPGLKPGYHVNDADVIQRPDNGWLFMYYTGLEDKYATKTQLTRRNHTGFAFSSDDGRTWYDHGIIIKQDNGFNKTGAWAPSAIYTNDEVWLYYHTGSANCSSDACNDPDDQPPRILLSKFDKNGWQKKETVGVKNMRGEKIHLVNVDVEKKFGHYWLIGNAGTLKSLHLYLSKDGVNFRPYDDRDGLLLFAEPNMVLTPEIVVKEKSKIDVYFGFSIGDTMESSGIHKWEFELTGLKETPGTNPGITPPIKPVNPVNPTNPGGLDGGGNGTQLIKLNSKMRNQR